jgi:hypothetical protein
MSTRTSAERLIERAGIAARTRGGRADVTVPPPSASVRRLVEQMKRPKPGTLRFRSELRKHATVPQKP